MGKKEGHDFPLSVFRWTQLYIKYLQLEVLINEGILHIACIKNNLLWQTFFQQKTIDRFIRI